MKRPILIAIVVVIVVVIAAGGFIGYNAINANQPTPTPSPSPASTQVQARDSAIMQIATNHTDIASLTANLTWTGGRQETGLVGSETYIYISGNWNVTITNPVVPNPIYTISAVYTDTAHQVTIEWKGTYQNSTITETSYTYVVP